MDKFQSRQERIFRDSYRAASKPSDRAARIRPALARMASGNHGTTPAETEAARKMLDRYKSMAIFKSNFDEDRIRVTEGRRIYNRARIAEAEADGAPFICFRPVGDCCNYCKSLYENPDGSPKLFALSAFKKGLARTGGTNQGVSKRQWSPYVEIAHPWCRCRPEAIWYAN